MIVTLYLYDSPETYLWYGKYVYVCECEFVCLCEWND